MAIRLMKIMASMISDVGLVSGPQLFLSLLLLSQMFIYIGKFNISIKLFNYSLCDTKLISPQDIVYHV